MAQEPKKIKKKRMFFSFNNKIGSRFNKRILGCTIETPWENVKMSLTRSTNLTV